MRDYKQMLSILFLKSRAQRGITIVKLMYTEQNSSIVQFGIDEHLWPAVPHVYNACIHAVCLPERHVFLQLQRGQYSTRYPPRLSFWTQRRHVLFRNGF